MFKQIFSFLALISTAAAFAPVNQVARAATSLAMEVPKPIVAATAGFMPAILSSTAAVATEGTNEWFGVDDLRVLAVLFVGHWAILSLWLGAYGDADEEQDFFGEIDYTGRR